MKIEINFPADFEGGKACPLYLGRFLIGPYVARLSLHPDGNLRIAVPKPAVEEGFVQVYDVPPPPVMFGFGKEGSK
jgi:hypothetical protein